MKDKYNSDVAKRIFRHCERFQNVYSKCAEFDELLMHLIHIFNQASKKTEGAEI